MPKTDVCSDALQSISCILDHAFVCTAMKSFTRSHQSLSFLWHALTDNLGRGQAVQSIASVLRMQAAGNSALQDYLTLPDPSQIYKMSSLDMAFTTAYNSTRDFAMRTFNLTEDQAITAVTTVMDFGVTQVVDGKSACAVVQNQTSVLQPPCHTCCCA